MNCIILGWVNLAMAKILELVFGISKGEALWIVVGLIVLTSAISTLSGLWGVLVTDLFQFVIKMGMVIVLAVVAVQAVGGIEAMKAKLALIDEARAASGSRGSVLSFVPDVGSAWMPFLTFFVYIGVNWWATWYPGAEPGGGGSALRTGIPVGHGPAHGDLRRRGISHRVDRRSLEAAHHHGRGDGRRAAAALVLVAHQRMERGVRDDRRVRRLGAAPDRGRARQRPAARLRPHRAHHRGGHDRGLAGGHVPHAPRVRVDAGRVLPPHPAVADGVGARRRARAGRAAVERRPRQPARLGGGMCAGVRRAVRRGQAAAARDAAGPAAARAQRPRRRRHLPRPVAPRLEYGGGVTAAYSSGCVSASTTRSATCERTRRIALLARVGLTRFVSRMMNKSRSGSIQIDVPV